MTKPDTPDTSKHTAQGNTKVPARSTRSRSWFFTLNNFDQGDVSFFTDTLDTEKYAFQHEVGENGTHHLQGVIYFKNATHFNAMKELHSKVHWEKTKCLKNAIGYCCDPSKRAVPGDIWVKGWSLPKPLKIISELRPWQEQVINLINQEPDERTINWFWEPHGNTGKTVLIKYILSKYKNVHYFSGGKASDIAFQIIKNKWDPEICIFGLPRTAEGAVSYNALEQLKDGLVFSPKYEGGTKIFNSPHVIVFANWKPDTSKLSEDRWNVVEL
ncbi:Rep [uncultured virus]|uniref:Rep n=1 Tax=uncultured virus TaxID=340016 RepID=A0A2K9LS97_9VIRU|nr:Rep [uncultured virus]